MTTFCKDCGIDAGELWDDEQQCIAHEDFYVHDDLWDATCPDDHVKEFHTIDGIKLRRGTFVLCIGCFEQRLGRELRPTDFKPNAEPDGHYWRELVGTPSSARYRARLYAEAKA